MKYDLKKTPTRGAQRTLQAFSTTMYQLIANKAFEEITVNQICEISNFPRATFYNYFDDKYDLLDYCWYLITKDLQVEMQDSIQSASDLTGYLDRLYYLLDTHRDLLQQTCQYNPIDSTLVTHFNTYLKKTIRRVFYTDLVNYNVPIPLTMLADHYSNTVIMMLVAMFRQDNPITLDQAHEYLAVLLGNLVKP